jgi:hypothetical protein
MCEGTELVTDIRNVPYKIGNKKSAMHNVHTVNFLFLETLGIKCDSVKR